MKCDKDIKLKLARSGLSESTRVQAEVPLYGGKD